MRKKTKKLFIAKETLTKLDLSGLPQIAGGQTTACDTSDCTKAPKSYTDCVYCLPPPTERCI